MPECATKDSPVCDGNSEHSALNRWKSLLGSVAVFRRQLSIIMDCLPVKEEGQIIHCSRSFPRTAVLKVVGHEMMGAAILE